MKHKEYIQFDKFNSEIFGIKMANLNVCNNDYSTILEFASIKEYQHLTIKVDTRDIQSCNLLLKNGFYIVDTLISYKYNYFENIKVSDIDIDGVIVETAKETDIEQIKAIAATAFIHDRFHNDSNLDYELCNRYYEKWAENSCRGYADVVLCAKNINGVVLGFITVKQYGTDYAVIDLNAVKASARGMGIYTLLVNEVLKFFYQKVTEIRVGTQINTYAAQKTWCKLGFKVFDSRYVLHRYM